MAHLPIIEDVYRVTLQWSPTGGCNPANVMHFSMATGNEDDLAAGLDASWQNGMFGVVSSTTSVIRYDILKLDGTSTTKGIVPDPANSEGLDGQAGGTPLYELALCIAFQTDVRGPRARGRIYLGPVSENNITGPAFNGVDFDVVSGVWQDFNDALVGLGTPILHGVASYKSGGQFNGIGHYRTDHFPATMRRRLVATRGTL